ncbi:hypothetical protein [Nodularia sp. NIES-3585]|uniref:hypothetical protein n=1 Tax=Nodularia sp. NIES-3585 TaxID=1973477 RepID=UPI000B5C82FD|nr:hypothetical protein [Nodularia sp. NIES-3585]GAX39010.1 hypothetical protein NIES3585_50620 [Nodularia sp. NIES-3585]
MHPIEFKEKWGLSYEDLALVLGYESAYTCRCWGMKGCSRRNPQNVVRVACHLLDQQWSIHGKKLEAVLKVQAGQQLCKPPDHVKTHRNIDKSLRDVG